MESIEGKDTSGPTVQQLMQLRAMYELTTAITSKCFETCLPRLNPRLEESDKSCMSNCAANFLHMKLLFTQRLIDAAKATQLSLNTYYIVMHKSYYYPFISTN